MHLAESMLRELKVPCCSLSFAGWSMLLNAIILVLSQRP